MLKIETIPFRRTMIKNWKSWGKLYRIMFNIFSQIKFHIFSLHENIDKWKESLVVEQWSKIEKVLRIMSFPHKLNYIFFLITKILKIIPSRWTSIENRRIEILLKMWVIHSCWTMMGNRKMYKKSGKSFPSNWVLYFLSLQKYWKIGVIPSC